MKYELPVAPNQIPMDKAINNVNQVIRGFQGDASIHEALSLSMRCIIDKINLCESLESEDIPRLTERIEELEKQIESLNLEKSTHDEKSVDGESKEDVAS